MHFFQIVQDSNRYNLQNYKNRFRENLIILTIKIFFVALHHCIFFKNFL